ncbi:hypothetical protein F4811DRAFT_573985 [Daldinia bambusicola]|nr:hypothetical protein F4811DRAFT_573985 [Daldinia bambusicola]
MGSNFHSGSDYRALRWHRNYYNSQRQANRALNRSRLDLSKLEEFVIVESKDTTSIQYNNGCDGEIIMTEPSCPSADAVINDVTTDMTTDGLTPMDIDTKKDIETPNPSPPKGTRAYTTLIDPIQLQYLVVRFGRLSMRDGRTKTKFETEPKFGIKRKFEKDSISHEEEAHERRRKLMRVTKEPWINYKKIFAVPKTNNGRAPRPRNPLFRRSVRS